MIHGWDGSPEHGWFPWLAKDLETRGYEVFAPLMPDAATPTLEKWLSHLSQIVGTPDESCYFVGHSLGCITILRYIETLKENQRVGGAILVAGFSHDLEYDGYKGELKSFFQTPVDFQKIKKHCKKFIAIQSLDDRWVNPKNADILEENLNAKKIIQNGMKHYSGDDGTTELPIALKSILEISK